MKSVLELSKTMTAFGLTTALILSSILAVAVDFHPKVTHWGSTFSANQQSGTVHP
jgi:hypothetical protein